MNISDINSILTEYRFQREKVQQQLDNIDHMMKHWVTQRELMRDGLNPTDDDLFTQMFGPSAASPFPSVGYTYTEDSEPDESTGWN